MPGQVRSALLQACRLHRWDTRSRNNPAYFCLPGQSDPWSGRRISPIYLLIFPDRVCKRQIFTKLSIMNELHTLRRIERDLCIPVVSHLRCLLYPAGSHLFGPGRKDGIQHGIPWEVVHEWDNNISKKIKALPRGRNVSHKKADGVRFPAVSQGSAGLPGPD